MTENNNTAYSKYRKQQEELSPQDIRAIICSIKRKAEAEFQESLKHMTPEEREKAIEFANALL